MHTKLFFHLKDLHAEGNIEQKDVFEEFVEIIRAIKFNFRPSNKMAKAILSLDSEINLNIDDVRIQGKITGPLQFDNCK